MRLIDLLIWKIYSAFRRIRYDLARELVVIFCSIVVLTLFTHIFNDFLNVQVAQISTSMRSSFASALSLIVFVLLGIYTGRSAFNGLSGEDAYARFMDSCGLDSQKVQRLSFWLMSIWIIFVYVSAWFLVGYFLNSFQLKQAIVLQLMSLFIAWLSFYLFSRTQTNAAKHTNTSKIYHQIKTLLEGDFTPVNWRLKSMLLDQRSIQLSLLTSVTCGLLFCFANYLNFPKPALFLIIFTAGLFMSFALCLQLSEDLQSAWFEQINGLSHPEFISIHKKLAAIFSLPVGIIVCTISFAIKISTQANPILDEVISQLQYLGAFYAPAFLVAQLGMQIDGKKLLVSFSTVFLLSLFLATACFAHILGLVLFLLIPGFTEPQQSGRFYRA